jgi:hypothetical protein
MFTLTIHFKIKENSILEVNSDRDTKVIGGLHRWKERINLHRKFIVQIIWELFQGFLTSSYKKLHCFSYSSIKKSTFLSLNLLNFLPASQKNLNYEVSMHIDSLFLTVQTADLFRISIRIYFKNAEVSFMSKWILNVNIFCQENKCHFFLMHFSRGKLHAIFNTNIPKDATHSELSHYILIIEMKAK